MLKKLWNDEVGAVLTVELILVSSIVMVGAITGLASLRDALVTELADLGAAVGNMDQSYEVPGVSSPLTAYTAGSFYEDLPDPGDEVGAPAHPRCIVICSAAFASRTSEHRGGNFQPNER